MRWGNGEGESQGRGGELEGEAEGVRGVARREGEAGGGKQGGGAAPWCALHAAASPSGRRSKKLLRWLGCTVLGRLERQVIPLPLFSLIVSVFYFL